MISSSKGLVSNTMIGFVADLLSYALVFVASIIIARQLGPASRGFFAIITLFSTYLVSLLIFGIDATAEIQLAKKEYSLSAVHMYTILFSMGAGMIGLVFFLLLEPWLFLSALKGVDRSFILITVLMIPFVVYSNIANRIMIGMTHIRVFNLLKILKGILDLLGPVLFLVLLHRGLAGAVTTWMLSILCIAALQAGWLFYQSDWKLTFEPQILRQSLAFGAKVHFAFLPAVTVVHLGLFFLNHYAGSAAVGYYAVAYGLMMKIVFLFNALLNASRSQIIGSEAKLAESFVKRLIRHSFFLALMASLIICLLSRILIHGFYGKAYAPSTYALIVLLLAMVAGIITNFLTSYMVGQMKNPGLCAKANWGIFFFGLLIYYGLVPKYGLIGTAIATSLIASIKLFSYLWLLRWFNLTSLRQMFWFRKDDLLSLKRFLISAAHYSIQRVTYHES